MLAAGTSYLSRYGSLDGMMSAMASEPRRVYHSDPRARSAAETNAEFGRLARRVLAGLRDGSLGPVDAFDLAVFLLDEMEAGPPHPFVSKARELGEAAAAGADPERIAGLGRELLVATGFARFELEPELLTALERALGLVRADVAATGLTGPVTLSVKDWNDHAYAEFRGCWGTDGGIGPGAARDPVVALAAVADNLQDAIMESTWTVWPVCPEHNLGAHARIRDGRAVWWCRGRGHVIAPIGHWPG